MQKKTRISLSQDDALAKIDDELDAAMQRVNQANQRVARVLSDADEVDGEPPANSEGERVGDAGPTADADAPQQA